MAPMAREACWRPHIGYAVSPALLLSWVLHIPVRACAQKQVRLPSAFEPPSAEGKYRRLWRRKGRERGVLGCLSCCLGIARSGPRSALLSASAETAGKRKQQQEESSVQHLLMCRESERTSSDRAWQDAYGRRPMAAGHSRRMHLIHSSGIRLDIVAEQSMPKLSTSTSSVIRNYTQQVRRCNEALAILCEKFMESQTKPERTMTC